MYQMELFRDDSYRFPYSCPRKKIRRSCKAFSRCFFHNSLSKFPPKKIRRSFRVKSRCIFHSSLSLYPPCSLKITNRCLGLSFLHDSKERRRFRTFKGTLLVLVLVLAALAATGGNALRTVRYFVPKEIGRPYLKELP